jgi:hypothetical protein
VLTNSSLSAFTLLAGEEHSKITRSRGAMVARLTPDQKVACSSHVGVKLITLLFAKLIILQIDEQMSPETRIDGARIESAPMT